jgi:hypothetical protein
LKNKQPTNVESCLSQCLWGTKNYSKGIRKALIEEIEKNQEWYQRQKSQNWDDLHIIAADGLQLSLNHMIALCNALKRSIVVYVSQIQRLL